MLKKIKNLKQWIFIIISFIVICGGFYYLGSLSKIVDVKQKEEVTSEMLFNTIADAKELTTLKYYYTNMGQYVQNQQINGWDIPFTKKQFILSYDGVISAGIDLGSVSIKIDEKHITIIIPTAYIVSHSIDENSVTIFDETSNIFNPIKISDYMKFQSDQKVKMEDKAINNGLIALSTQKAQEAIISLLNIPDSIYANYEISVK